MQIKFRRDLAHIWATINPILESGEPGFERDTGKVKIGDGRTAWANLPYFIPGPPGEFSLDEHINSLTPHPVYDDGPSLTLLYENAKV